MAQAIEQDVRIHMPMPPARNVEAEQKARDLALMDEIEAFVQSLPDRRSEDGPRQLPDSAVSDAYEEYEAGLL